MGTIIPPSFNFLANHPVTCLLPSLSDSGYSGDLRKEHLSYSYFCCLNGVVLPQHNEFVHLFPAALYLWL